MACSRFTLHISIRLVCSIVAALSLFLPNPIANALDEHFAHQLGSSLLSSSTQEHYGRTVQQPRQENGRNSLRMTLIHRHELEMQHAQHVSTMQDLIINSIKMDKMRVKTLFASVKQCKYPPDQTAASRGKLSQYYPSSLQSGAIASPHPSSLSKSPSPSSEAKHEAFMGEVVSGASLPGNIGQYFVELSVGTPQQQFLFIPDTGSDLIWVPCSLCKSCTLLQSNMSMSPSTTSFLAEASSTFTPITCSSPECTFIPPPPGQTCNSTSPTSCTYTYGYSDLTQTTGIFVYDTITMRSSVGATPVRLGNVALGCGINNTGRIARHGGVMGLGQGPISFSSQVGPEYGNKFFYCFTGFFNRKSRSVLVFGDNQGHVKIASTLQFTPFISNQAIDTFYFLQIESVKVDKEALPIKSSVFAIDEHGNGGVIIDSGTTLTFFAKPAFHVIFGAFKKLVHYPLAPPTAGLQLCYNVSNIAKPRFPRISIIFKGGAIFRPPPRNYFLSPTQETRCLGFMPSNGMSVLGNLMQQNYYVEYDRQNNQLGFAKANCSPRF